MLQSQLTARSSPSPSSSSSPFPSPPPRRLAPQRKKVSNAKAAIDTPTDTRVAVAHRFGDRCRSVDEEDATHADEEDQALRKITTHVADWSLDTNYHHNGSGSSSGRKSIYPINHESKVSDEEEHGEDVGAEFHGEIESIASSSSSSSPSSSQFDNEPEEDEEMDGFIQIITEEHIPLNPPAPTLPLVLVDVAALTGCVPENEADKSILVRQLMESLLGTSVNEKDAAAAAAGNIPEHASLMLVQNGLLIHSNAGDGLSLHFDERVMELFGSGVAYHVDSSHPIARACMITEEGLREDVVGEAKRERNAMHPYAIIPYPEFLAEPQQEHQSTKTMPAKLRSTHRMWKLIHTVPSAPATSTSQQQQQQQQLQMNISHLLSRIFAHLRNTSRSLIWKANMHIELCYLANDEYKSYIQRLRLQEHNEWKAIGRRVRLEKLYDIRETFQVQVEVAKKKYDLLAKEREGRVELELMRRRRQRGERSEICFGSTDNYVNSNICDIDDDCIVDDNGWGGGNIREDEILGDETSFVGQSQFGATSLIDDEHNDASFADEHGVEDDNEEWSPLEVGMKKSNPSGMHILLDGVVSLKLSSKEEDNFVKIQESRSGGGVKNDTHGKNNNLETISHDDNLQRIYRRLMLRSKWQEDETMASPNDVSSSAVHEQRLERLRKEESSIRDMLKTTDERIAEATWLKLEERLQNVDELVESLQEEEWADDEEGDVRDDNKEDEDVGRADDGIDSPTVTTFSSLLDQILAMILGALPKGIRCSLVQESTITDVEYFRYIKDEHESIVKSWIKVFGRLPPLSNSSKPLPVKGTDYTETELDDCNKLESVRFGDDFTLSEANIVVTKSDNEQSCDAGSDCILNKDFTPIDNDGSTWDEVEDWDTLFP